MKASSKTVGIIAGASVLVLVTSLGLKTAFENTYKQGVTEGRVGYVATPTESNPMVRVEGWDGQGYDYDCIAREIHLSPEAEIVKEGYASSKEGYSKTAFKRIMERASGVFGTAAADQAEFSTSAVCRALGVRN